MHGNQPLSLVVRLLQTPLFCGLEEASLGRLARQAQEIRLRKGEVAFHEGQPFAGLFVILDGQLKRFFSTPDGNEKVFDVLGAGACCGEASLFTGKAYGVSAEALCETILLKVSAAGIFEELPHSPVLAGKMLGILAQRTHQMLLSVESLCLCSGIQRTVRHLLELLEDGVTEAAGASLTLPTSKGILASRLNLTPEHFSRLLTEMQGLGLIVVNGRRIDIPDVAALRRCLDPDPAPGNHPGFAA